MSMDVEECIRAYPLDARRAARRLRQDRAGAADGRALSADVPAITLTGGPAEPAFFRGRELGARHRPLALRRGGARRADDAGRVRRARGGRNVHGAGPLQRARHRVDDGGARRGARHVAAGNSRDPGRRRRARARRRGDRRARGRARARGPAPAADPHGRGVRQRDHAADGDRRRHERGRPPARARGARGRAARRSTASTSSRGARRCSRTCGPRASTSSRTSTARAASAPCCSELAPLLHAEALTVTGRHARRGDRRRARSPDRDVIAPLDAPRSPRGRARGAARHRSPRGRGDQAERRVARAASPPRAGRRLRGRLRRRRADRRSRARRRRADSVLVLRNSGPKGGPGMPEWGQLPIPSRCSSAA